MVFSFGLKKNGKRFVVEKGGAERRSKQVKVNLIKMAIGQVSTGEKGQERLKNRFS